MTSNFYFDACLSSFNRQAYGNFDILFISHTGRLKPIYFPKVQVLPIILLKGGDFSTHNFDKQNTTSENSYCKQKQSESQWLKENCRFMESTDPACTDSPVWPVAV
jgi:hypothetical protein